MAGLDDYQFFSNLRNRDTPFWQKSYEERDRPVDATDFYRRPTEFPQTLINPSQGPPVPQKQTMSKPYDLESIKGAG